MPPEINENQVNDVLGDAPVTPPAEGVTTEGISPAPGGQPEMWEYQARGQTVKEDRDTILKRASMGYDYAQNMETFKKDKDTFNQSMTDRESRLAESESKWKQYDEYARSNPEWETHVRTSWEQKQQQNPQGPSSTVLDPAVQQRLDKMDSFMDNYTRSEEDAQLHRAVDAVKSKHPDIDFVTTDPANGKSLEFKVIEHANQNGINNFEAAFYHFYHDQLIISAQEKAKKGLAENIQTSNREGFIAESTTPATPMNGGYQPQDKPMRERTWDEQFALAAQDQGIF